MAGLVLCKFPSGRGRDKLPLFEEQTCIVQYYSEVKDVLLPKLHALITETIFLFKYNLPPTICVTKCWYRCDQTRLKICA